MLKALVGMLARGSPWTTSTAGAPFHGHFRESKPLRHRRVARVRGGGHFDVPSRLLGRGTQRFDNRVALGYGNGVAPVIRARVPHGGVKHGRGVGIVLGLETGERVARGHGQPLALVGAWSCEQPVPVAVW